MLDTGKQPCVCCGNRVYYHQGQRVRTLLAGLVQERQPLRNRGEKWTNAGLLHSARTVAANTQCSILRIQQRRKRVFAIVCDEVLKEAS